jgi:hypothetical protein
MDQYQLIASVLWTGLGLALLAAATAALAGRHARYGYAVLLLFAATIYTLLFASISGFSIGRFVAVIPVMLIGYAIAQGRGYRWVVISLIISLATYFAFSWLLTPIAFAAGPDSPLAAILGAWGIPLYAGLALVAFTWTAFNPPRSKNMSRPQPVRSRSR